MVKKYKPRGPRFPVQDGVFPPIPNGFRVSVSNMPDGTFVIESHWRIAVSDVSDIDIAKMALWQAIHSDDERIK